MGFYTFVVTNHHDLRPSTGPLLNQWL